jgi:hypothetical protein
MTVPGAGSRPDRRAALALLGAGLLAGCAGAFRGTAPPPRPENRAGPYRLRVAIFEARGIELPFHAGLLIDAPEGRILYDPAGLWRGEGCERTGDVHHPMTDAEVARYLARGALDLQGARWRLHLFETEVPPQVASQAHAAALSRPPAPMLTCAYSVAALLSELPGFEQISPRIVTARLLVTLRARPDMTYTRRDLT